MKQEDMMMKEQAMMSPSHLMVRFGNVPQARPIYFESTSGEADRNRGPPAMDINSDLACGHL